MRLKRILKWIGLSLLGLVGGAGLLAAAMWTSEDVRYRVAPAVSERHFRALRSATLIDADGKPFDWHKEPHAVIWFNLWSYFCAPCRIEFSEMAALQARVGRDKLRIVLLSQPQYWEKDKKLAKELGLDFELVTTQDAPIDELAAIDMASAKDGAVHDEIYPTSSFQSAQGRGLAAYRAPGSWDSDRWEAKIRHWYDDGRATVR